MNSVPPGITIGSILFLANLYFWSANSSAKHHSAAYLSPYSNVKRVSWLHVAHSPLEQILAAVWGLGLFDVHIPRGVLIDQSIASFRINLILSLWTPVSPMPFDRSLNMHSLRCPSFGTPQTACQVIGNGVSDKMVNATCYRTTASAGGQF